MGQLFTILKEKPFFIAEIGINHNGDFNLAKQLIKKARDAGADAVKFQTIVPELMNSVYTNSLIAGNDLKKDKQQINFFQKFVFTKDEYLELKELAESFSLIFFSSPFDEPSISLLEDIRVDLFKVASSEITNLPLLKKIAATKKDVILSTGMSSLTDIQNALSIFQETKSSVVLLHCVSLYPVSDDRVNLKRIVALKNNFDLPLGFSDHSVDSLASEGAFVMGARVFEKHFSLSDDFDCPDKAVSLSPARFKEMVDNINRLQKMFGTGEINPSSEEKKVAFSARRSIFATRDIPNGKIVTEEDIVCLRPGTGIGAENYYSLLGKKVLKNISKDDMLSIEDIEGVILK